MSTDQLHNFACSIAGGIDHNFALDFGLDTSGASRHRPFEIFVLAQADYTFVASHACAECSSRTRHRLCYLRGVNVAIEWIPQCTEQIVSLEQWISIDKFGRREHVVLHVVGAGHALDMAKLSHALFAVRQTHRASHVITDRKIFVFSQLSIERRRIFLHLHDAVTCRISRHIARRVPRRT